ncbi:MAG: nitronate monooxygenase [Alcanivoracaceae bacterium]|jgi:nitronate monooxygenase|nr:nitronate monooxygenase [Alcanivoracaceae bacterium]
MSLEMRKTLLNQLGIEVPVICGPMYPGSNPELVAAVSEAGGMGVVQPISMTHIYQHEFRAGLRKIKSLTDKPFGVNFTLMDGVKAYEYRNRQWMDIAIEEGVKFFLTSLGNPKPVVKVAREHGITVYHDVSSRAFADKAVDAGVDGLNCVNNRAGGQTGQSSPQELLKALSDMNVPLVCAGGVGDEGDFKAMLEAGYAGVQLGTRFLATHECQIPDDYKQAIVAGNEDDIVWTNKLAGTFSSVIRTPDIERLGLRAGPITSRLLQNRKTKKLTRMLLLLRSTQRYKKVALNPGYAQYWQAGKGIGAIRSVESAGDIVRRFAAAI